MRSHRGRKKDSGHSRNSRECITSRHIVVLSTDRSMKRLRSLIPRFGASAASPKLSAEALEMKIYDGFLPRSYSLSKISYHRNHYLYGVSNLIKSEGVRVSPGGVSPNAVRGLCCALMHVSSMFCLHIVSGNRIYFRYIKARRCQPFEGYRSRGRTGGRWQVRERARPEAHRL